MLCFGIFGLAFVFVFVMLSRSSIQTNKRILTHSLRFSWTSHPLQRNHPPTPFRTHTHTHSSPSPSSPSPYQCCCAAFSDKMISFVFVAFASQHIHFASVCAYIFICVCESECGSVCIFWHLFYVEKMLDFQFGACIECDLCSMFFLWFAFGVVYFIFRSFNK